MRPLTLRTIQTSRERFFRYTLTLKAEYGYEALSLIDCLNLKTIYAVITSFPVESYSNRHNTFYAIFSLARYLVQIGELDESFLVKLKKFRPKRVVPPKRTVLRDTDMIAALRAVLVLENFKNQWSYQIACTVVETLMQTGLRNTELCQLKLSDVDLTNQRLNVYLGKGRKNRKVGIPAGLIPILQEYLTYRLQRPVDNPYFFLNFENQPYYLVSLGRLIKKLSKLSGISITAHGLRRTFATLNAEQGRPLHLIQLALGHTDIRTTQEYLMTDEEAVIEAMKDW
jgi:integrase